MAAELQIVALDGQDRSTFDCEKPSLNNYLQRTATKAQRTGASKTFVGLLDGQVAGYYSLSATSISYESLPKPHKDLDIRHPVPAILLGRWAVDKNFRKRGFGPHLLLDAMKRSVLAAEHIGVVAFVVDPLDVEAKNLYMTRYGFKALQNVEDKLYLPMQTVRDIFP